MKLILPYPVSANRYWRTIVAKKQQRALTFVSDEAKKYKTECGWLAKAAGWRTPLAGAVELRIRLVPKNRVCMDLDNALKVTIDALKGIVYADDAQVFKIVAERADPDPAGARLEIEALPLALPIGTSSEGGEQRSRQDYRHGQGAIGGHRAVEVQARQRAERNPFFGVDDHLTH